MAIKNSNPNLFGVDSPVKIVLLSIGAIFVAETQVMIVLYFFDLPPLYGILIDAVVLVCMLVPVVYFFMYAPLKKSLDALRHTQAMCEGQSVSLAGINQQLKKEIQEREAIERQLVLAKEAAEQANRSKSEFLANMSHEIRTPLNGVIGMTEVILLRELSPEVREYQKIVKNSAESLMRLINDILDFSKIEAGRLELEEIEFSLHEMLENLSITFADRVARKSLEFIVDYLEDVPDRLIGDPYRLEQVLNNLINNALKFTEEGGIHLKVTAVEAVNAELKLQFTVRDTGIGIDPQKINRLFEAFSQADSSTTRKYGGTGLGLAISKNLVDIMGGKMWVYSRPGVGSEFHFTVLFTLPEQEKERLVVPDELRNKKILIIDDSEDFCGIMKRIMDYFGLRADYAMTAQEGLAALEEAVQVDDAYDLICLDWLMPGMNGIEVARRIRQDERLTKTPIIMLTGFGRDDAKQQADEVGIELFLHKPVQLPVLYEAVLQAFGHDVKAPKTEEESSSAAKLVDLNGRRILVVDDQFINLQVASELLRSAGADVDTIDNGQTALEMLARNAYDILVLDVQMPKMDGFDVCRHLRRDERFADLPIIAMTANALKGDREKCLAAGMDDYVAKPLDPGQFLSTLLQWLPDQKAESDAADSLSGKPKTVSQRFEVPESLPGIRIRDGIRRLLGNVDLYLEMLGEFEKEYLDYAAIIRTHWKENRTEQAWRTAHALKGASGNVAVHKVHNYAGEIERRFKAGDLEKMEMLLLELDDALCEFQGSLLTLLKAAGKR